MISHRRRQFLERRQRRLDEEHRYKLGLLREFVAAHGWGELRRAGQTFHGVNLFNWVHGRRTDYKAGEIRDFLVPELEAIPGWSWDHWRDHLREQVDNLRRFVKQHGWNALTVETEVEGVKLSGWCATRRTEYRRGTLAKWLIKALEAIPGWSWDPVEEHYEERLAQLRAHVARHGWDDFGIHTEDEDGERIGKWANHIRDMHRRERVPAWVCAELESIDGWMWEPREDKQRIKLEALRAYAQRHGLDDVAKDTIVDGVRIGDWLFNCLHRAKQGVLPRWLARELERVWKQRRARYTAL